jgi:Catalytic LigB subunit of aromatic ring-opening dioxygenase
VKRRQLLETLGALPVLAGCSRGEREPVGASSESKLVARPAGERMPVVFAAHGAPMLLDDRGWVSELFAWAQAMPKPRSILMVSAHWEERPATLGATRPVPLVYDFYGFPERYYQTTYPAPGAPDLSSRVRQLLSTRRIAFKDDPQRGLDHGAYVPLLAMYPAADVPVLQLSLPALEPQELLRLGQALSPLRDEGVLLFGSGFLTHNMRYASPPGRATSMTGWRARSRGSTSTPWSTSRRAPQRLAWRCRLGSTTRRCSSRPALSRSSGPLRASRSPAGGTTAPSPVARCSWAEPPARLASASVRRRVGGSSR